MVNPDIEIVNLNRIIYLFSFLLFVLII